MPWFVCMHKRSMFLVKYGCQPCVVHIAHWLKVEPKQSILFFKIFISFSMIVEEVHAIDTLGGEAWQTCESISFYKVVFFLETKSNSFEIKVILFFKDSFFFTTKLSFEDRTSFFSKQFHNHFYFSKFHFLLGQGQVGISKSHVHLKSD